MDMLTWAAIAGIGGLGVLLLSILKWVASIARQQAKAESMAERADAVAAGAIGKCELLGTDFHNHRVEIAGKVADINARAEGALTAIVNAENRFARALEDFGDRIDKVVDRLDRVLEARHNT